MLVVVVVGVGVGVVISSCNYIYIILYILVCLISLSSCFVISSLYVSRSLSSDFNCLSIFYTSCAQGTASHCVEHHVLFVATSCPSNYKNSRSSSSSLPAITATSYYKIVGVAVLAFRLSLLLPTI